MRCRAFTETVSSEDKVFRSISGGYHEVMLEECGPELIQGMIDWILARTGHSAARKPSPVQT